MIEELKQLLTLIQDMPEMVVHVLIGFGIYKLIIFMGTSAGIYGTLRLAINKWHDYKVKVLNTPDLVEYKISDKCLTASALSELERLIDEMKTENSFSGYMGSYVSDTEIALVRRLLREYRAKAS